MRVQLSDRRFYGEDGSPRLWSQRVDDAWRARPEASIASNPGDDSIHMDDGVAVFTLDTPVYDVAGRFTKFFQDAGNNTPVRIDIDSPGGLVSEGTAIRAMMLRHPGHVTAQVMGVAASAAQFITTGADDVLMAEGSFQMLHRPWSVAMLIGDFEQMENEARSITKLMKQHTQAFEKILAKKMKIPQSRVSDILKAETWYTPEEAVEARLADSIYPVVESDPEPEEAKPQDEGTQTDTPFQLSVERLVEAIAPAL